MNKIFILMLFFFVSLTSFLIKDVNSKESMHLNPIDFAFLEREIEPLKKIAENNLKLGFILYDLQTKRELFNFHPDDLLIPASLSKLITSWTALKKLGPTYRFLTELRYQGDISKEGVLKGDLWVIGKGDPFLVSEKLENFISLIQKRGLTKIEGDLCYDTSYFQNEEDLRDDFEEEISSEDNPYNAKVSALSFNFNSVGVVISPSFHLDSIKNSSPNLKIPMLNSEFSIHQDPIDTNYITIIKDLNFTSKNVTELDLERKQVTPNSETFLLKGNVGLLSKPITVYKSISRPGLYTAHVIKSLLAKHNIPVTGEIKECPSIQTSSPKEKSLKLLYQFESEELATLLKLTNRFSNNFMCEQIFLTLGAEEFNKPGTPQKSIDVIKKELNTLPIKIRNYQIKNGSGLTYQNLLSVRHFITVLNSAYSDFSIFPEFIDSLARPGVDGTLKKWFPKDKEMEVLRAKTGSLSRKLIVRSIGGYLSTSKGHPLAFVWIANIPHHKNSNKIYELTKKVEDKILLKLIKDKNF